MKKVNGIYTIADPRDVSKVRYVGSSTDCVRRIAEHARLLASRGNQHAWAAWLRELMEWDLKPHGQVIEIVPICIGLKQREHHWINHYHERGMADLNVCINLNGTR